MRYVDFPGVLTDGRSRYEAQALQRREDHRQLLPKVALRFPHKPEFSVSITAGE